MISNPDQYIKEFVDAGADIITVHFETCPHLHRSIQLIKSFGVKAGVALNPHTPVHALEEVINDFRSRSNHVSQPWIWWSEIHSFKRFKS